jgi:Gram-negative bacterial TonB protein C-terminal
MSQRKAADAWGGPRIGLVLLLLALALAGLTACRSAGGPPPKGPGALTDAGRALVGQRRLVRFHGQKKGVSVKLPEAAPGSGICDVAVEVKTATFSAGSARFSLQAIGRPRVEGGPREKQGQKLSCRGIPNETSLVVSGLDGGSADELTAQVGRVLLTPEDYLQAQGARFDRPATADPKEVADAIPTASHAEQRLAESITAKQRCLLAIEPLYRGTSKKTRYEGQVEFVSVVGTDGRLHQAKVTTPLGDNEDQVLRVLPLWRYEPARRGDQPVAVRLRETVVFRIF